MNRVLVTGATGFLGTHIVDALLENRPGLRVRILSRGPHRWTNQARVETVVGDILDADAVSQAVRDVDGIFHLAGFVTRDKSKAPLLFETHIRGSRNVCESALRNGSPRVVVASSSGTIAASRVPVMHSEDSPYCNDVAGNWPYYLSKIYQEKLALSYYANHKLPVIILNPSLLLGPGDDRLSSTADIHLYLQKQIPNIPSGGLNFVDVRDAAHAAIRAMDVGVPGRRYLIGGHNMTVKDFFGMLEKATGVGPPKLELPESWSRLGASLLRKVYSVFGRQYALDATTVEMAYRFWYVDNSRAQRELGLSPRPPEETVRDTVAYLRQHTA